MQKLTYEINNAEKLASRNLYLFSGYSLLIMGRMA